MPLRGRAKATEESARQRMVGLLRDLEGVVADLDFETEFAAECLDIAAQGVDLGLVEVAAFDPGHAVLADVEFGGEFNLGEIELLAEFPQPPSAGLGDHPVLVGVDHLAAGGPALLQLVQVGHVRPSFSEW